MNHAGVLAATCCVLALVQPVHAFVAVPPAVNTRRPGGLSSLDVRQQAASARPHSNGAEAGVRGSRNCRRRQRHVMMGATAATRLESLTVSPISLISGEVELPGSKSLSNRVLLLSALAEGTTKVENLLDSEDIQYMLGALKTLKVSVDSDLEAKTVEVVGNAGPFEVSDPTELFLGNAGTAMRPLTAVVCAGKGEFVMDGTPRMRERPIVDLVDGLKQLGVDVSCSDTGCPPVNIKAAGLNGGTTRVSGKISSQYLSALLMAAPLSSGEVVIEITDELVSAPYVHMTIKLMDKFGVKVKNEGDMRFTIKDGQKYVSPGTIAVEGDASSASYFLGGAAITGGPVTVRGCGRDSVQGDVRFAEVLEKMGATLTWEANAMTVSRDLETPLRGVDVDCGEIPDAAMTLAVIALFAEGPTAIRNVYNWRVKETERMKAIVTELGKLGAEVEEGRDYCIVTPPKAVKPRVAIDTYDDHRMAMCFSLAACAGVPVTINDPECTAKTFPTYFKVLGDLTTNEA
ncbi:3-Phosphoshikimate 1-Carboxyvinyltransferase [Ectocarpus siliculosus]|uniref:3-phosphoshikimate 1-carboxyvinyltransferase n=1 Tax=Ectocarpus siliculosus TaxID=2880 RepID=D8LER1_ECTSI|nr:3-Phosphoshikimate 1-Carboxyvinyltransferase [Ectocarpus siliculosus]|eukprot:CBN78624.1 3-Phosphoshikimate 1-Carboxyvinyltransferase [Ectocarpus siliculosus]